MGILTVILAGAVGRPAAARAEVPGAARGAAVDERVFVEGGVGVATRGEDAFTRRLQTFGLELGSSVSLRYGAALGVWLAPGIAVVLDYAHVDAGDATRTRWDELGDQRMRWSSHAVALHGRIRHVVRKGVWPLELFAQLGLGYGFGSSELDGLHRFDGTTLTTHHDTHEGVHAALAVGAGLIVSRRVCLWLRPGADLSTTLDNELGDLRAGLGVSITAGLRVGLWSPP